MSYRYEKSDNSIVIDGFEKGIAPSPYLGIGNIRNMNISYYPGVAYTNYKRQAATTNGLGWFAGSHSTNVSNNSGWIFSDSSSGSSMGNPLYKAVSPAGLNYVLDSNGNIWKQSAVNSSTFSQLSGGTGRLTNGNEGLAYWNNYLVVFGSGVIEFCGDGTGDSGVISTNWNKNYTYSSVYTTNSGGSNTIVTLSSPSISGILNVNDPITVSSTGALSNPLTSNTTYYVKTIDSTGLQITISSTVGGSAIMFNDDGSGTQTLTLTGSSSMILPIGNCTNFSFSSTGPGATSITIVSYVDQRGISQGTIWRGATGTYAIIDPGGNEILGTFTNGSSTVSLLNALEITYNSNSSISIINTSSTTNKAYVSKVDGNLYFANSRAVGRILSENLNQMFNPGLSDTYTVNYSVVDVLDPNDTVTDLIDLQSTLIVSGKRDLYTWDYISPNVSAPVPIGENISSIINILSNVYIMAGQKGNIYISNGFSAQFFYKLPDFIAGVIDPVWSWGGTLAHRSRLFMQVMAQNSSTSANILAGVFSLVVSSTQNEVAPLTLIQESQNSYGLTPSSGAVATGVLLDNNPSSTGFNSYYSAWSNGASTGGIDYNDTTPWGSYEPTIETDIIPIGTILGSQELSMGNIEFKLDRPMVTGDSIRLYYRISLSDSYTLMGTTTTSVLSDYYQSNVAQAQWVQFKAQMSCAPSGSSFVPLREIRIYYN